MSPGLQYEVTAVNKGTGIQYKVCIFMPFPQQYLLEPSPHFTHQYFEYQPEIQRFVGCAFVLKGACSPPWGKHSGAFVVS